MVLLYTPKQKNKNVQTITADILDLDYQGLGVAKINGKTWFIENALPHEKWNVVFWKINANMDTPL